jgi:signal transduction histidine kinase
MNNLLTVFILFAVASCCLAWQSLKLSIQMKEQRERDKHLVEMLLKVSRFAEALTDRITRQ